jgi:hypothetical protein
MSQASLFDRWGVPIAHVNPSTPVTTTPASLEFRNRESLAHHADPLSSRLAAAAFTESGRRTNHKRALLEWMQGARDWRTSAEIAAASGFERHGVARRLPDLEQDGRLERRRDAAGAEILRVCQVTGERSITWRAIVARSLPPQPTTRTTKTTQTTPLRAREAAPAAEPVPEPAKCERCDNAGIVRVSQDPDQYEWCDVAAAPCIHSEQLRAASPRVVEDSNAAALKLHARFSQPAAGAMR